MWKKPCFSPESNCGTRLAFKVIGESTVAHTKSVVYNGTSDAGVDPAKGVRPLGAGAVEETAVKREIVLQTEYDFFVAMLDEWLTSPAAGKFVLIKEHELIGFFDTKVQALTEGQAHFNSQPFFVSQVKTRSIGRVATVRPAR